MTTITIGDITPEVLGRLRHDLRVFPYGGTVRIWVKELEFLLEAHQIALYKLQQLEQLKQEVQSLRRENATLVAANIAFMSGKAKIKFYGDEDVCSDSDSAAVCGAGVADENKVRGKILPFADGQKAE